MENKEAGVLLKCLTVQCYAPLEIHMEMGPVFCDSYHSNSSVKTALNSLSMAAKKNVDHLSRTG